MGGVEGRVPSREEPSLRVFACPRCDHRLYIDSVSCIRCHAAVRLLAAGPTADWRFVPVGPRNAEWERRRCANDLHHGVCNWLSERDDRERCRSCALNRTVPDTGDAALVARWGEVEADKRRWVYQMSLLDLPLTPLAADPLGMAFDLLAPAGGPVSTGHLDGVITIDVSEADDARREEVRSRMREPYRAVLGHIRHESGHLYWQRLVADDPERLRAVRERVGDERADYAAALQRHYERGAPPDWAERHISAYASSHPWEDWAETWAHLLHVLDALETARWHGLRVEREGDGGDGGAGGARPIDRLLDRWAGLAEAVNDLNRSLGVPDLYPFVISAPVREKLDLVRRIIVDAGAPAVAPV